VTSFTPRLHLYGDQTGIGRGGRLYILNKIEEMERWPSRSEWFRSPPVTVTPMPGELEKRMIDFINQSMTS